MFNQPTLALPSNFLDLCEIVEGTDGVRFADLFARLPSERAATGDAAQQIVLDLLESRRSSGNAQKPSG